MINPMHISRDNIQHTHKENLWRLKLIRAVASMMRAFLNLIYLLSILTPSFCFRAGPQSTTKSVQKSLLSLEKKNKQMKLTGFIKRTAFRANTMSINYASVNCV